MADETQHRVRTDELREYCSAVLKKLEVPPDDASITADVLVQADLRGISSHGVARLRRYVSGIQDGMMRVKPTVKVLAETPATAALDAGGGLGQPVSYAAMTVAIEKARNVGMGFVTVRNSNHYGIAGYYAMMALKEDMIGLSMTNTDSLVVPTFGRKPMLGTNPIAVAMPAGEELPFVLDMATSVVPRGKIEVYERLGKKLPIGWATDERGLATEDAGRVLNNFKAYLGGLLPLGGEGETYGGHKGYGLTLMVDLLCGVLAGASYLDSVYPKDAGGKPLPADLGHVFGALRIDAFRPVAEFKSGMDDAVRRLHGSARAEGQDHIYIHGEKEQNATDEYLKRGIPLHEKVVRDLEKIGAELGVPYAL